MFEQIKKYLFLAIAAAVVVAAVAGYLKYRSAVRQIVGLQNEIARRDTTIEVQKQVYAKLILQLDDLKSAIDTSTIEGRRLADELKKNRAQVLAVSNELVKLKDQIASGKGVQSETNGRKRVEFVQDFGFVRVDGYTLTDPGEFQLKLGQGSRPLRLTTAISQLPDGSWKADVASSDENVAVDIGVAAVNPRVFEPRWYERLKLHLDAGAGLSGGVLAGVGLGYQFGHFDLGPSFWATTLGNTYAGVNLSWAPFKRD